MKETEIFNNKAVLPQPEDVSSKEKENGFGAYILMFAGAYFPFPFAEIIISSVYYFYFKKRSRYVTFHVYQSLLAQIPVTLLNTSWVIYGIVLMVRYIRNDFISSGSLRSLLYFLAFTVLINLVYIIVSLVIGLKAKKGEIAYFPVAGKIAYDKLYGPDAIPIGPHEKMSSANRPPL